MRNEFRIPLIILFVGLIMVFYVFKIDNRPIPATIAFLTYVGPFFWLARYSVLALIHPEKYIEIYLPNSARTVVMPKSKVRAGDRTRKLRIREVYFTIIAGPIFMIAVAAAIYFLGS